MNRPFCVAAVALFSWLAFGTHDASSALPKLPTPSGAQNAAPSDLRLLKPGTKLTVHMQKGPKVQGVLREVGDEEIVVEQKRGRLTTIRIADIRALETGRDEMNPVAKVFIVVGATLGALFVLAVAAC